MPIKKRRKKKTKVKFYKVEGLKCQGRKEVRYVKECVRYKRKLPTKAERVLTPLGYYTPDFEHDSTYIEIKSLGTLRVCFGEIAYKNIGTPSDLQWQKICWTHQNIKPIIIKCYLSIRESKPDLSNYELYGITIQFIGGRSTKVKNK